MDHFPFGESWYNATGDKLLFTTYERDAEFGNDYAQARYYVNRLARFLSLDPLSGDISDPQSLNRYNYVENDPANVADPSGADPEVVSTCQLMEDPCPLPSGGTITVNVWEPYCKYADECGSLDPSYDPGYLNPSIGGGTLTDNGGHGSPGFFGGPMEVSGLIRQAMVALLNPDCASLFGGISNATTSIMNSSYNRYVPGQQNPYPNQVPADWWKQNAQDIRYNPKILASTYPTTTGAFIFFTGKFNALAPGFGTGAQQTQLNVFFHEQEHATGHDQGIDANLAAYEADARKINENCKPPNGGETQNSPITGGLTLP